MAGLLTRSCCGRLPGSFFPVAKSRLLATNIWNLQQRDCSGFTPDSLLIAFLVCFEVCEPMRDKDREFIWLLQRGRSFSFVLIRKKKNQKERIKAAFFQLLRCFLRLKGRNSLRSNSLPFLTPEKTPALDAEKTRPGNHAAWARGVWACATACMCGVEAVYCSPFISRYSSMACAGASFRRTVLSLFNR